MSAPSLKVRWTRQTRRPRRIYALPCVVIARFLSACSLFKVAFRADEMPAQIGRILKLDRLRLRGPVARAPLLAKRPILNYGSLTTVLYATWPTDGALE